MATQYDWRFIQPLDQTANIAAMNQGNQQVLQGLAGIGNSVTGYADAIKQRNTDQILNTLMGAQDTSQLPAAMQAVQALQQQYGRGYDQTAVRNAIDTRGSTLGQRDLQAINLQQAQAAQAAIPQLNESAIAQAKARGVNTAPLEALAALGIDTTGQINSFANNSVSDTRDTRDFNYRKGVDDRNYNRLLERDAVGDAQWAQGNDRANLTTAAQLAEKYVTPAGSTWSTDANGNFVQTQTAGVSFSDALPAIMNNLFNVESRGVHRQSDGSLTRSPKGALGIAQIMPATAAKPGYGMKPINLQSTSPQQQQQWATDYIGRIQKAHNFTTEQAVAAYNAGPGAVQNAIKSGGSNWLSKLPKETRDYVPKVLGGTTQGASRAVGAPSAGISQAAMSKNVGDYRTAIAALDKTYNTDAAKAQTKGSLAATGKNVDTWAAGKKDGGLLFAGNDTFFTKASDLSKMAKADPTFNKLPEAAQINVLEGAYAKMNDVNAFQYVPDGDLKKFISRESANYQKDRVNQYNQQKQALVEQSYQGLVQQYQAAGLPPPSRSAYSQLVDPQAKPKAQPTPKPQPVRTTQPSPKPGTSAAPKDTRLDDYLAKRNADRAARTKPVEAKAVSTKTSTGPTLAKNLGNLRTGSLTQKELDELFKTYKVR